MASPSTVYALESAKTILSDPRFRDLILEQHAELTVLDGLPVNIDGARYLEWERAGIFKVFTVRVDKQLVGYVPFYLMPHPHHSTSTVATVDNYYLDPGYRAGTCIGLEMFRRGFRAMAELGAQAIIVHQKLHKAEAGRDVGKFFERLGFGAIETIYAKTL